MAASGQARDPGGEMTQNGIRRGVTALALTATVALAAPAYAAGRTTSTVPGSGWLESAFQWITGMWAAPGTTSSKLETVDTNSSTITVTPPPSSTSGDKGMGIDPNG
jgi:hypothetical protein